MKTKLLISVLALGVVSLTACGNSSASSQPPSACLKALDTADKLNSITANILNLWMDERGSLDTTSSNDALHNKINPELSKTVDEYLAYRDECRKASQA